MITREQGKTSRWPLSDCEIVGYGNAIDMIDTPCIIDAPYIHPKGEPFAFAAPSLNLSHIENDHLVLSSPLASLHTMYKYYSGMREYDPDRQHISTGMAYEIEPHIPMQQGYTLLLNHEGQWEYCLHPGKRLRTIAEEQRAIGIRAIREKNAAAALRACMYVSNAGEDTVETATLLFLAGTLMHKHLCSFLDGLQISSTDFINMDPTDKVPSLKRPERAQQAYEEGSKAMAVHAFTPAYRTNIRDHFKAYDAYTDAQTLAPSDPELAAYKLSLGLYLRDYVLGKANRILDKELLISFPPLSVSEPFHTLPSSLRQMLESRIRTILTTVDRNQWVFFPGK